MPEEDVELTDKERETLLERMKSCIGYLNATDFMMIYQIMIDACRREKAAMAEQMMIGMLAPVQEPPKEE